MRVGEVSVIRALRNVLGMRSICRRVWEVSLTVWWPLSKDSYIQTDTQAMEYSPIFKPRKSPKDHPTQDLRRNIFLDMFTLWYLLLSKQSIVSKQIRFFFFFFFSGKAVNKKSLQLQSSDPECWVDQGLLPTCFSGQAACPLMLYTVFSRLPPYPSVFLVIGMLETTEGRIGES